MWDSACIEVEWGPAREPAAQAVWNEVLRPVAGKLCSAAPELAVRSVAYMRAELPELFPDPEFLGVVARMQLTP